MDEKRDEFRYKQDPLGHAIYYSTIILAGLFAVISIAATSPKRDPINNDRVVFQDSIFRQEREHPYLTGVSENEATLLDNTMIKLYDDLIEKSQLRSGYSNVDGSYSISLNSFLKQWNFSSLYSSQPINSRNYKKELQILENLVKNSGLILVNRS
ncbi:MAG TPA: hypothetical protein VJH92_00665 [Candidatus Nanoarchaeia archaeon]|nr:hypothetical protein [Candidatus Nanoarchaeia archaeon]